MIVTRDMHERKRMMFEHADAFVALPGGVGTLEELVEQLTWVQLGQHNKPILIANINGFWEPLPRADRSHGQARHSSTAGLNVNLLVADKVEDILPKLREAAGRVSEADNEDGGSGWRSCERRYSASAQKRHCLDAIAVGIADEGRVIAASDIWSAVPARRRTRRPP